MRMKNDNLRVLGHSWMSVKKVRFPTRFPDIAKRAKFPLHTNEGKISLIFLTWQTPCKCSKILRVLGHSWMSVKKVRFPTRFPDIAKRAKFPLHTNEGKISLIFLTWQTPCKCLGILRRYPSSTLGLRPNRTASRCVACGIRELGTTVLIYVFLRVDN